MERGSAQMAKESLTSSSMYDSHEVGGDELYAEEIETHNKEWIAFVNETNNFTPQDGSYISQNHVRAGKSSKMYLLEKGCVVIANYKKEVIPIRIVSLSPDEIHGELVSGVGGKAVKRTVAFKDIVLDGAIINSVLAEHKGVVNPFSPKFYKVGLLLNAKNHMDTAMWNVVKVGQVLEYVIPECPKFVAIAEVLKNQRGLLLVKYGEEVRWVHMFDQHCQAVGWLQDQTTKKQWAPFAHDKNYVPGYSSEFLMEIANRVVPKFVFCRNTFHKHRLRTGDLLCVADHKSTEFWIAHAVETENKDAYHFHVSVGKKLLKNMHNGALVFFHIHHPRIFSVDFIEEAGIGAKLVRTVTPRKNETKLAAYQRVHARAGRIVNDVVGCHGRFTLKQEMSNPGEPIQFEPAENLRFVEVLRTTSEGEQMCAAEVTGMSNFMLRLRINGEDREVYMHYDDPSIYHVGSSLDMKLAVLFDEKNFASDATKRCKGRGRQYNEPF
ncbi:unnamed protein product [Caenorhabditis sp. 36 PRJEB53466]|nr:unnamed protein product [Caenorhabditis sp. 36 PRJEB53466]